MIHCDGKSEKTLLTLTLPGQKGEQSRPGGDLVSVPKLISDLMGLELNSFVQELKAAAEDEIVQ